MKFNKIAIALVAAATAMPAMAQFEGTDHRARIIYSLEKAGVSGDDLDEQADLAGAYISEYQTALDGNNWAEALRTHEWLMEHAPYCIQGIYTGKAPLMFYQLVAAEEDVDKKIEYFNKMQDMFDKRLARLDTLNSFTAIKNTRGDVLAARADYSYWCFSKGLATQSEKTGWDTNKLYDSYHEAIKEINENGGREIQGSVLQNFIYVSDLIFKANKTNSTIRERYLQDYMDSKDACERMLQLAKEAQAAGDEEKAQKLVATYDAPLAWIENTFTTSGAAEREQVIAMYEKTIENKKDDLNYLRSAMTLMSNSDCDDADIYYQAAQYAYAIEPTFESAIGLAQNEMKTNNVEKAVEYYNKALELATNDKTKGNICMRIASGLRKANQFTGALSYLDKATGFNGELTGKANLQKATVYTQLGQYNDAISWAKKASEADITQQGTADRLIASIQKAQANQAANAKAKAAYDAYMAKKKAEEDFWAGK